MRSWFGWIGGVSFLLYAIGIQSYLVLLIALTWFASLCFLGIVWERSGRHWACGTGYYLLSDADGEHRYCPSCNKMEGSVPCASLAPRRIDVRV